MKQAEVNIGLIGHVDHGKTSVTKMLTGKWTDTHSEELKRGISIRLGFADASIYYCEKCKEYRTEEKCSCNSKAVFKRRVSFVDAPGHENLMATMLSGASIMDGAILVIAANEECPQKRTIEHLVAIKMSGVKDIVVVQNKVDLVSKEDALKQYEKIKSFLKKYGFENAPIIPTAANIGVNKSALIEAIEETIKTPKRDENKDLFMWAVRSFDVNLPGTDISDLKGGVIGGTIVTGKIRVGDVITIKPFDKELKTKVISLATEKGFIEEAKPGGLIAVATELDPALTHNDAFKGKVLGNNLPKEIDTLEVTYESLERELMAFPKDIYVNEPLVLTIGTATNIGIVLSKKDRILKLKLKSPAVLQKGQKIAISRRLGDAWHLYGYGIY